MFSVTDDRFEELVEEALTTLPDQFMTAIDNVAIIVDADSAAGNLFGLYHGIPLTRRDSHTYSGVMPDEITLYKNTICSTCDSEDDVRQQVRITLVHEIGHYFGIDDDRLGELGWA